MERRDEDVERIREVDESETTDVSDTHMGDGETHATTGGAAAAGAVTGGVIGLTGGPIGAAIGAVGGAIVGAAAERMMHSDDDARRDATGDSSTVYRAETSDVVVPSTNVTSTRTSADITSTGSSDVMPPRGSSGSTAARAEDITTTDATEGGAP
jgi:outer membrane lipoprotein SlyB